MNSLLRFAAMIVLTLSSTELLAQINGEPGGGENPEYTIHPIVLLVNQKAETRYKAGDTLASSCLVNVKNLQVVPQQYQLTMTIYKTYIVTDPRTGEMDLVTKRVASITSIREVEPNGTYDFIGAIEAAAADRATNHEVVYTLYRVQELENGDKLTVIGSSMGHWFPK